MRHAATPPAPPGSGVPVPGLYPNDPYGSGVPNNPPGSGVPVQGYDPTYGSGVPANPPGSGVPAQGYNSMCASGGFQNPAGSGVPVQGGGHDSWRHEPPQAQLYEVCILFCFDLGFASQSLVVDSIIVPVIERALHVARRLQLGCTSISIHTVVVDVSPVREHN